MAEEEQADKQEDANYDVAAGPIDAASTNYGRFCFRSGLGGVGGEGHVRSVSAISIGHANAAARSCEVTCDSGDERHCWRLLMLSLRGRPPL